MKRSHMIALSSLAVLTAIAATAATTAYVMNEPKAPVKQEARVIHHRPTSMHMVQAQPATPPCNDGNILGTVSGGVIGGVLGNQFGSGSGKTLATLGGAAGGAYLGNQYIPTRNTMCN